MRELSVWYYWRSFISVESTHKPDHVHLYTNQADKNEFTRWMRMNTYFFAMHMYMHVLCYGPCIKPLLDRKICRVTALLFLKYYYFYTSSAEACKCV